MVWWIEFQNSFVFNIHLGWKHQCSFNHQNGCTTVQPIIKFVRSQQSSDHWHEYQVKLLHENCPNPSHPWTIGRTPFGGNKQSHWIHKYGFLIFYLQLWILNRSFSETSKHRWPHSHTLAFAYTFRCVHIYTYIYTCPHCCLVVCSTFIHRPYLLLFTSSS